MSQKRNRRSNHQKDKLPLLYGADDKPIQREPVWSKATPQPPKPKKEPQPKKHTEKHRKRWPLLTIMGVILSALSLLVLLPRITVAAPSVPVDQKNALSVSFHVTNSGFTTLNDVEALFAPGQIGGSGTKPQQAFVPAFDARYRFVGWEPQTLPMDIGMTINTSQFIRGDIAWGDIAIVVQYRPWILPFRCEKLFRFTTYRESNGSVYWREWPIGKVPPPLN